MDKKSIMRQLNRVSELASTSLPRQTLVELLDTCRLIVENHKGVCQYSTEQICIRSYYGFVCIGGSGLHIARMTKEQLVITGNICSITTQRKHGG